MTQEEINRKINNIKAIWGIENMRITPREEERIRLYLMDEITEEELMRDIIADRCGIVGMYKVKSSEEQDKDRDILRRIKWRQDVYFEQLQLRIKLEGIDGYAMVNEADRAFSSRRAASVCKIKGAFDLKHFLNIHEHLFQDVYYFAGKIRDVPMQIDPVTRFVSPMELKERLDVFFANIKKENYFKGLSREKLIERMAEYLTDINIIHPFREGNGRSKRVFFQELIESIGYYIDWGKCTRQEWIFADECAFDSSRDGKRDTSYLKILLDRAIEPMMKKHVGMSSAWQEYCNTPLKETPMKKSDKNMVKDENCME